jgi:tetratricopeptide (TPR) repeat protein
MKKNILIFLTIILAHGIAYAQNTNGQMQHLHNYFMANYYQFGGQWNKAYERYKQMLLANAPLYSYKGYIHLLYDTGNLNHILQIIPELDQFFKPDADIAFIFAQVLDKTDHKNEADDRFIRLNDQYKANQEIAFNAANSYLRRKEPENAIKVIDNLLNSSPRKPNNFIFYFMKSQIFMSLNNKEEALKNVQKSVEIHPRFDKGWLLFALLNEQKGQLQDAIKGYTNFLESSQNSNRDVEQHLLQLVFKQKVKTQHNYVVLNKGCFEKALTFFDQKQYHSALQQIDLCLAEKPEKDEAKLLKIQIMSSLKQPQKAADLLRKWIVQNVDNNTWFKTLHLLTQSDLDINYAINILKHVEHQYPKALLPHLYAADLHTRAQHHAQAIAHHKKALELATDDNLKAKILHQIGLLYYEAKNFDAFKEIIEHSKKLQLSFAPLDNLIAYYYATQEDDINQAETLITKALKTDQHNPHFLDTKALICLKQKKYKQARSILEKIVKKVQGDYTILVHLAQSQFNTGDAEKALTTLKQAQGFAKNIHDKKDCEQLLISWQTKKL